MDNKWKEIFNGIKGRLKLPQKNQLLILLLAGILLVVIALPTSDKKPDKGALGEDNTGEEGGTSDIKMDEEYEHHLERRIAQTLEYMEGVGKAEVMITLRSSGQKIIEKDQKSSSQTSKEEDSSGGTRTEEDKSWDRTSIYRQDSNGSQAPYVSKELTPEIEGVLVIAQGGDNAVVVQNITEAVQALFGVEAHKIKIMKRTDT